MVRSIAVSSVLLSALLPAWGASPPPVTTGSLVEEMVDMARLARFPGPAYKTLQFSSYDRRSKLPGGPDWFANSDGFGREPVPNFQAVLRKPDAKGVGEYLLCDVRSPGAIVRTWTAANAGRIRLYLDDADKPLYDGSANEFLRQPYLRHAQAAGLDPEGFEASFRQRDACYFPMPFAKRCRIVWVGDIRKIHFYEVQVRRYEPGTKVVPFEPRDLKTYRKAVEKAGKVLAGPHAAWKYASARPARAMDAKVKPGETVEALSLTGSAAIERLTLRVRAKDVDRALRQTVLHITFDGYPTAQVQSPVGDFFGAGPGINPYDSVPFTVRGDGEMTCRYVMPFARSCAVRLENRGDQPVTVTGSALVGGHRWEDGRSLHFRARWRVDHGLTSAGGTGARDLPFLIAQGKGVYVGTAVMLMNPNPVPTPYGSWWGEGDEKIFVDDDLRPSTFGTGSEDYFNYSWSVPEIFGFAYCGQPRDDGPANRGFVVNHRWHVLDAMPFASHLAFYMELYSHERTEGVSYARLAYHYGAPGLRDDHVDITAEDVRPPSLPPGWQPAARMGARGSTFFPAEDVLADKANTTLAEGNLWAGGRLLVWRPARAGDEVAFTLPVRQTGQYVVRITAALTPDSGPISARLDAKDVGFGGKTKTIDLRVPHRTMLRTFSSRKVPLTQGDHVLTLRHEGQPGRGKGGKVGVDFLWVQKR